FGRRGTDFRCRTAIAGGDGERSTHPAPAPVSRASCPHINTVTKPAFGLSGFRTRTAFTGGGQPPFARTFAHIVGNARSPFIIPSREDSLMHPIVFVDVDTQFDFMDPAGALYVPG